jgi:glycosyltransferase involved in cell wall biosynthesis
MDDVLNKRLLHVIGSVNPTGGGPIEGILQQAAVRLEDHWDVEIATLDSPDSPWLPNYPVKVHALGNPGPPPAGWRKKHLPWVHYGYTPNFVPWLRRHVGDYDIVVVNGLWNFSACGARHALLKSEVPYVVFTHGMLDPWFKKTYPFKSLLKQVFWWICEGPLLREAQAVLFTTEEEMVVSRNAFWPYHVKERVVGYGTSDVKIDREKQGNAFRALVPELKDRPYLLFLSRIHPKKGCDLLVEAFAAIAHDHPELDLVIAGPDQTGWRKALESRAQTLGVGDRIFWPGMLSGDAKWGAYSGAEAFVLPSHQENFGIVVAEAMAVGKPVLITNKINVWREVDGSKGGIVESDDEAGIIRLLRSFLALSPTEKTEMGQNARNCFLEHFEIHQAVKTINAAFVDAAYRKAMTHWTV